MFFCTLPQQSNFLPLASEVLSGESYFKVLFKDLMSPQCPGTHLLTQACSNLNDFLSVEL